QVTKTIYTSPNHFFFLTPFQPYAVSNPSLVFFPLVFFCRPTLSPVTNLLFLINLFSFLLSPYSLYKIARFTKKILSREPTELFIASGENESLPTIEGDGGVRTPSLVELTVEDSEFTVVGRVKRRDEALQDKIHHLGTAENGLIEFKEM
ncbi:unnamed protein product, partial [Brassica oleracea var. botrytis]